MTSFKDLYSFTPRTDYISTHVKPYALMFSLLPEPNSNRVAAFQQVYQGTPTDKRLQPGSLALSTQVVNRVAVYEWRDIFNKCDTEEKMALLFERM
jgi:hypothetical protein